MEIYDFDFIHIKSAVQRKSKQIPDPSFNIEFLVSEGHLHKKTHKNFNLYTLITSTLRRTVHVSVYYGRPAAPKSYKKSMSHHFCFPMNYACKLRWAGNIRDTSDFMCVTPKAKGEIFPFALVKGHEEKYAVSS